MDTSLYTWPVSQGSLSLIQEAQGYGLFLDTGKTNIRIEENNIEVEGVDVDVLNSADKTTEFFQGFLPIVSECQNVYTVVFYEMNVIELQDKPGINKGVDFNALKKPVLVKFSPTAPAYRRVIPGLNLRGTCSKAGCAANGDTVYVPIGICGPGNKYQIPRLIFEKAICPSCQNLLPRASVTNLGFWKCQYTIDGILEAPDADYPDCKVQKTVVVEDKKFTTFKPGDMTRWACLDITTESASAAAMRAARNPSSGSHPKPTAGSNPKPRSSGCVLF